MVTSCSFGRKKKEKKKRVGRGSFPRTKKSDEGNEGLSEEVGNQEGR